MHELGFGFSSEGIAPGVWCMSDFYTVMPRLVWRVTGDLCVSVRVYSEDTEDHCHLPRNTITVMKLGKCLRSIKAFVRSMVCPTGDQWTLFLTFDGPKIRAHPQQWKHVDSVVHYNIKLYITPSVTPLSIKITQYINNCKISLILWDMWEPTMTWRLETLVHKPHRETFLACLV